MGQEEGEGRSRWGGVSGERKGGEERGGEE